MWEQSPYEEWCNNEAVKEKTKECRKRKGECADCPYEEDCAYELYFDDFDEW